MRMTGMKADDSRMASPVGLAVGLAGRLDPVDLALLGA